MKRRVLIRLVCQSCGKLIEVLRLDWQTYEKVNKFVPRGDRDPNTFEVAECLECHRRQTNALPNIEAIGGERKC